MHTGVNIRYEIQAPQLDFNIIIDDNPVSGILGLSDKVGTFGTGQDSICL